MTTRHSERLREMAKKKFKVIIKKLIFMLDIFENPDNYSGLTKTYRAKRVRCIYILVLENIRLFHKYFPGKHLKAIFKILTTKGYEIIHCDTYSKNIEKIVEKPILDMVTYIYKYNETISRVSYKLSEQMNKDVGLKIISYM
jgi:hypothetical protein